MKFFTPLIVASTLICLPTVLVATEQDVAVEQPFSYLSKHDTGVNWLPTQWYGKLDDYLSSKKQEYIKKNEAYIKKHEEEKKSYLSDHAIVSGLYYGIGGTLPMMCFVLASPIDYIRIGFGKILAYCAFGSVTIFGGGHYLFADPFPKGFRENPEGKRKERLLADIKTDLLEENFLTQVRKYPQEMMKEGEETVSNFIDSVMDDKTKQ